MSLPKLTYSLPCVAGSASAPSVVFWGDSHASSLAPVADWSARAAGQSAVVIGHSACPPLPGVEIAFFVHRTCAAHNDEVLAWVRKELGKSLNGLVLSARWSFYSGQDTPARDASLPRPYWRDSGARSNNYDDLLSASLTDLLATLGPVPRVLILVQAPDFPHSPIDCLTRAKLNGPGQDVCAVDRDVVEQRQRDTMHVLSSIAAAFPNVRLVDPIDVFCDRSKCRQFGIDGIYYFDTDHLNGLGVERLYRSFESEFAWLYGN
jgi:hypothetical protein